MAIEWSNSKLGLLQRCGEAFRRRYIEGEDPPSTLRMKRGSAVHRVARVAHLRQMRTREQAIVEGVDLKTMALATIASLPSQEETRDLAATSFEEEVARGVTLTPEETNSGRVPALRGEAMDSAVRSATAYITRVAPSVVPLAVERRVTVRPKDFDLVISGTLDLVHQAPTGDQVRDLKVTEKNPNRDMAENSQQLTMYAMLRGADTGRMPKSLSLVHVINRGQTVSVVEQPTTRTMDDVRALLLRLTTAVEAVEKGVFVPAQEEHSWWCSPGWCEFYSTCRFVNASRGK